MSTDNSTGLALMPCCHETRIYAKEIPLVSCGQQESKLKDISSQGQYTGTGKWREGWSLAAHRSWEIASIIDAERAETLRNRGYKVDVLAIPEEITPKNRLLVGEPTNNSQLATGENREYSTPHGSLLRSTNLPASPWAYLKQYPEFSHA